MWRVPNFHLIPQTPKAWRILERVLCGATGHKPSRGVIAFAVLLFFGLPASFPSHPHDHGASEHNSRACRYCVRAAQGIVTKVLSQPWEFAVIDTTGLNVTLQDDSTPTAEAKQTLGSLAGRVTDQENVAVPLVRVIAEGGSQDGRYTTETRQNGDYRLNGLDPGLYRVTFINVGFQIAVYRNVKVLPGKTVMLNVRLRVDPCPLGRC